MTSDPVVVKTFVTKGRRTLYYKYLYIKSISRQESYLYTRSGSKTNLIVN